MENDELEDSGRFFADTTVELAKRLGVSVDEFRECIGETSAMQQANEFFKYDVPAVFLHLDGNHFDVALEFAPLLDLDAFTEKPIPFLKVGYPKGSWQSIHSLAWRAGSSPTIFQHPGMSVAELQSAIKLAKRASQKRLKTCQYCGQ